MRGAVAGSADRRGVGGTRDQTLLLDIAQTSSRVVIVVVGGGWSDQIMEKQLSHPVVDLVDR
jgi:hypothetical protein